MTTDTKAALETADAVLQRAKQSIDAQFGEGYAAAHQLVVVKFLDGVFSLLAATTRRVPE
jgi:hypothetical protein